MKATNSLNNRKIQTLVPGKIEQICRNRGLRMTGPRYVVASLLDTAEDHPTVIELYRRAAAIDEKISLSTVYRILRRFETEGIIEKLELREGRPRYEPATDQHHDHLIDIENGSVIEFQSEEMEKLQAEIALKLGYRLVSYRLELYGTPLPNRIAEDS